MSARVMVHNAKRLLCMFTQLNFLYNDRIFMVVETGCHYLLSENLWSDSLRDDDRSLSLSPDVMTDLLVFTVGTSRGVVYARKPKELDGVILPMFDVSHYFANE